MKYFIIDKNQDISNVISFLIKETKLPNIQRRLNIYSDDGFEYGALNNNLYFKKNPSNNTEKMIYVKNKNLKEFFKYISSNNKKLFQINDIVLLNFSNCILLFNTFHGNIISTDDIKLQNKIKKNFSFEEYNDINKHEPIFFPERERLFDEAGNLNNKIKQYSIKVGMDIRSSSSSIRLRLSNLSNDYSHIENYFKLITNTELLSFHSNNNLENKFKNMSIIIPVYNQNVIKTLLAIQSQNISLQNKKKIQVILVDDGSNKKVTDDVKTIENDLDFELNIITFNKNMGISNARNAGLAIAKYDLLLFIDSDIILSKNYIYDMNIRLQIVPNAIFVAMRKNVDKDSDIISIEKIKLGIENRFDLDDSRVITKRKAYHVGWDKAFKDDDVNILDDTDYFKQLGFGSKIGIYDLPSVVTGHNMAINRAMLKNYPVFSTEFVGWGMEDSYFAASLISSGCFVIPLLSSCVFHIDHPPRSGSMQKKTQEASINFEKYNNLLDKTWED